MRIYVAGLAAAVVVTLAFLPSVLALRSSRIRDFALVQEHVIRLLWQHRNDPAALQSLLREAKKASTEVSLYDARGDLLSSTSKAAPRSQPTARAAHAETLSRAEMRGRTLTVPIRERGQLVAFGVSEVRSPVVWRGARLLGVLLAILLVATLLLARLVAGPLEQLARVAERFGRGELTARAGMSRRDEIGEVARAFDAMADRVTALMRAQQELIANLSHELLTPLARVRLALEFEEQDAPKPTRYDAASESILHDLNELEQLLDDVMTLARIDLSRISLVGGVLPLRLQSVALDEVLRHALERFRAGCSTHEVELELAPELPRIILDPVLVRRGVENLLDNARKYSEPGTSIRLRAESTADLVRVSVSDQGVGIDAADMDRLFTPFFRADRSRSRATVGVGLGLALTKRVVDAHGGRVSVTSLPAQGTTFVLELPVNPRREGSAGMP